MCVCVSRAKDSSESAIENVLGEGMSLRPETGLSPVETPRLGLSVFLSLISIKGHPFYSKDQG